MVPVIWTNKGTGSNAALLTVYLPGISGEQSCQMAKYMKELTFTLSGVDASTNICHIIALYLAMAAVNFCFFQKTALIFDSNLSFFFLCLGNTCMDGNWNNAIEGL